jgi:hypothetical protein
MAINLISSMKHTIGPRALALWHLVILHHDADYELNIHTGSPWDVPYWQASCYCSTHEHHDWCYLQS